MLTTKAQLFIAITFSVCWAAALIFYLLGLDITTPAYWIFSSTYMLVPGIVALVLHSISKSMSFTSYFYLQIPKWNWLVFAWVFPVIIAFLAFGIALLFPDIYYSINMESMFEIFLKRIPAEQVAVVKQSFDSLPAHPLLVATIQSLFTGITINALFAMGEELGWRGLLAQEILIEDKFNRSALIGLIWGVWHSPLILMGHNFPQHMWVGLIMMPLFCIVWSIVFTFFVEKSGSLFTAAVLHGTINSAASISFMMLKGGNDLLIGATGLSGIAAILLGMGIIMDINQRLRNEEAVFEK